MNVAEAKKELKALKSRRAPWESLWDLVARFTLARKIGFTTTTHPGDFYNHGDIFDDTAPRALNTAVSSIMGALWKGGARTFRLKPPRKDIPLTEKIKAFYETANERFVAQVDHVKAGFVTAFQEFLQEDIAFGTCGFGVFRAKSIDHLLSFKTWGLKGLYIQEDAQGRVNKIYYEEELTAKQVFDEYGARALEIPKIAQLIKGLDYETKVKVVVVLKDRKDFVPGKPGVQNMPIESTHFMLDENAILRESGYHSLPVNVVRFYKLVNEEYGRSPGSEALPSTVELNVLWEMITRAIEKKLFPSLWVMDDGTFGNGTIDLSPNAVTPIDMSSHIQTGAPIGVIGEVGELNSSLKLVEVLSNQILAHFFNDRLLDLNNKTRQTLGEAQIRNELRGDSMGAVYYRQYAEGLTPSLRRGLQICTAAGELGVRDNSPEHKALLAQGKKPLIIPEELFQYLQPGDNLFEFDYISPASRILRAEELRGITMAWQFAGQFVQADPAFVMRLNADRSMKLVRELTGAPSEIENSDDEFKAAMAAYQEAMAAKAQNEMRTKNADASAKEASAQQMTAQANATDVGASGLQLQ